MLQEIQKELAKNQELLRTIDSLSNTLQQLKSIKEKNDLAYFIHQLIEDGKINTNNASIITGWKLKANQDPFINVSN